VVELLLSGDADVNSKDNEGKTPLQWAVARTRPTWRNCCGSVVLASKH